MDIGPLLSTEIHYDKSGRSMGEGSVIFEDRTDAIRAINQYSGVPLDGNQFSVLHISLVLLSSIYKHVALVPCSFQASHFIIANLTYRLCSLFLFAEFQHFSKFT